MSPLLREAALLAYQRVTKQYRQSLVNRFRSLSSFPGAVLFYHRVADTVPNSWSISSRNFIQHLDWLGERFDFVSLEETREAQISGTRSRATVHITFDDGYSENWLVALPELVRRGIPTTYFVSTHYIESGEPFPHDVAAGAPLRPNTLAEIQSMVEVGITIGAHSHTHVDFGQDLSDATLRREISDVRKKLQDWTGQPIYYFAFPYGLPSNVSQRAIDIVFESGFLAFVSAAGGFNFPGGDHRHLQRIHADPGMAALTNWLTYDPRKTMRGSPIQYSSEKLESLLDTNASC